MFLGHFAMAFGAKKVAPKTSLGTLFIASQFIDLLWPVLLLLGIEHVRVEPGNTVVTPLNFIAYPYSHSLLSVFVYGVLLAAMYWAFARYRRGAITLFFVLVSHWLLDLISHRPDLPLYPGSSTLEGLGLWNSLPGTLIVEGGLFIVGIILYVRATKSTDRIGIYALWLLILFLTIMYAVNIFGPPPPGDRITIGVVGLSSWLLMAWAYWIDRHRRVVH
jgi:hypothetical protein